MYIIRLLIIFCTKRALKYEQMKDMLLKQNDAGFRYIYAIGTMVHNRDKWLKRIKWLSKTFGK